MEQYKFKLAKIHCAGCALALEQNINEIDGVVCEINFVTKLIKLDISAENPEEKLAEVKDAISRFDHSIQIIDFKDEDDEKKKEKLERELTLVRLAVALVFSIIAYFLPIFWLKVTIFALVYLLVAYKILIAAGKNIIHGKVFDENFLMSIASIGAFIIQEFSEAIFVVFLYEIGEILEDLAVDKSRRAVKSLLEIKQPYANLIQGDEEIKVAASELKIGDIIRIKPGEKVPVDGVVVDGLSYLDMSILTGETKEQIVQKGDKILSGSINVASVLLLKVETLDSDSTISKIVDMVEKATESKAKSEKFISKFSRVYTPIVIALAAVIAFIPPIFSGYADFVTYAYRSLCFLVVSCPCALVISVPLTYFAGIGSFARSGVMVKGANFVEALAKTNCVIFDKTGTLTEGNFEITEIFAAENHTEDEILETAAYAESFSNHRIAKSVIKAYKERTSKEINSAWISDYTECAGMGIKANIFMQDVLVGNAKLFAENDVTMFEVNKAGTVLYVSIAGEYAGYIVIDDVVKSDAAQAVSALKNIGIRDIELCTGDGTNVAEAVSKKVGISEYHANMLPEDKVKIVSQKVSEGKSVVFVGDGINDAPSLASANVGMAMGGFGSDIAVEASDVILMTDEPSKVAKSIKKARKTHRIVLENIIGSISIKVAILLLITFGLSGMWLAVFADVGVNLIAIINGLRASLK